VAYAEIEAVGLRSESGVRTPISDASVLAIVSIAEAIKERGNPATPFPP
jgi:hypothetical protein